MNAPNTTPKISRSQILPPTSLSISSSCSFTLNSDLTSPKKTKIVHEDSEKIPESLLLCVPNDQIRDRLGRFVKDTKRKKGKTQIWYSTVVSLQWWFALVGGFFLGVAIKSSQRSKSCCSAAVFGGVDIEKQSKPPPFLTQIPHLYLSNQTLEPIFIFLIQSLPFDQNTPNGFENDKAQIPYFRIKANRFDPWKPTKSSKRKRKWGYKDWLMLRSVNIDPTPTSTSRCCGAKGLVKRYPPVIRGKMKTRRSLSASKNTRTGEKKNDSWKVPDIVFITGDRKRHPPKPNQKKSFYFP